MGHADPVATGHVTSLSRPGGNIIELSVMMTETSVKGLELFKQAVPGLARVAVIFDPATPSHTPALKAVEAAGPALGLQVQPVAVRSETEFDSAFSAVVQGRADAVLVLDAAVHLRHSGSRNSRLTNAFAVWPNMNWPAGSSYWSDTLDTRCRGAIYVDKIPKGAKPATCWSAATRFELVINLKTAKALA
jgi:putative ABC transport system substrate-binding protein